MKMSWPTLLLAALFLSTMACENGDSGSSDLTPVNCQGVARSASVSFTGKPDGDTCAWLGIPFAEPPTGNKRFRPAQLLASSGDIDATRLGNDCIQDQSVMTEREISEDCLQLNVWAPGQSRDGQLRTNLPVMVWFYGGGFVMGSANWSLYNGANYARDGVVLVAVNYRLGALGWAAPPGVTDADGTVLAGNLGLTDQLTALEWVQQNIRLFGGDPDRVTIFGESAGGWSVCALLGAGAADKGLVHGAIMESGACFVATPASAQTFGTEWLDKTSCPSHGFPAMDCLRDFSAEQLNDPYGIGMLSGAFPNVDGKLLSQHPIDSLRAGDAADIPMMAGFNHDELEVAALADLELVAIRFDSWQKFWSDVEEALGRDDRIRMQQIYPEDGFETPFDAGQAMVVDQVFGCAARDAVAAQASHGASAYLYRFALTPEVFPLEEYIGSFHGLEVPFVFGNLELVAPVLGTDQQLETAVSFSRQIRRYWTRFAATGNPNGGDDPLWPRFSEAESALELRPQSSVTRGFLTDRCAFWNKRLPGDINSRVDWILDHIPGQDDPSFFKGRR